MTSVDQIEASGRIFTIVPDVNILVSAQNANRAGRVGTISQRILGYLTSGWMNDIPVQTAVSFKMIDTFRAVLQRNGMEDAAVGEVAQALIEIMRYGPRRLDP